MTKAQPMEPKSASPRSDEGMAGSRGRFLDGAITIAGQIRDQALRTRNGLVWMGPPAKREREPALGPYLYDGTTGIALFLAALERTVGGGEFRDTCLLAIAPLRQRLREMVAEPERASRLNLRIGAALGLCSWIYALIRIGDWLGDSEMLAEARDLVVLLTPDRIRADTHLDVVSGSAGALLVLLALEQASREAESDAPCLELASLCAEHLLAKRTPVEPDIRGWCTVPGQPPLCGFSHGAAGITYALLRLFEWSRRPELLEAAHDGLAFERRFYSPEHRNWRDLRFSDGSFMTSWCHGAPGIALGRLGVLDLLDDAEIRDEIQVALDTTRSLRLGDVDHLCCGNMGRADILLQGSRKLNEPEWLEPAKELAEQVLHRAEQRGFFGKPRSDGYSNPTLFLGSAGMGYTLLRLADPALPCVLIME